MQLLEVSHLTEYQFADLVTLGPHRLLIRPREGHDIRIQSSELKITPKHQVRWARDVFNNSVGIVSFLENTNQLSIFSKVIIQHYDEAPLDFIVEDYAVHFPFDYKDDEYQDLLPFLSPNYPEDDAVIREWLRVFKVGQEPMETYVLLDRMSRWLKENIQYTIREEPGVKSPAQTLGDKSGSCRDYATLFMEGCRQLGLACRFVSGYLHAPSTEMGNASTHAWAEVFLPGPGWKGVDPTSGEIVGTSHIATAVSRHPETVPPVSGSFVGVNQKPSLRINVQVTALPQN